MGKFIFSLESLLNLREKIEKQKEMEYGEAISLWEQEKERLKIILLTQETQLDDFRNEITSIINSQMPPRYNAFLKRLKQDIYKQKIVIEAQGKVVEEKRMALVIAMQERKTMEKLEEREIEVFVEEEKRAEQRMVDEVVSFRFNSGKA